jgi:hypothetical protein
VTLPRRRAIVMLMAASACVAAVIPPAFGAWRSISTIVYDDGGRTCRNIAHFSLAHELATTKVKITDITADPDIVVTPLKTLNLRFSPTPELFGPDPAFTAPYHYSGNFRVPMDPRPAAGHIVRLRFNDGSGVTSSVDETVQSCTLGTTFVGFTAPVANPPTVNQVADGSSISLKFGLNGNQGTSIFSESPRFAPMPCTTSGATPAYQPTLASGSLTYRADLDRYTYAWNSPQGLSGCYSFWFRTKRDGLTHRALFNFT